MCYCYVRWLKLCQSHGVYLRGRYEVVEKIESFVTCILEEKKKLKRFLLKSNAYEQNFD